MAEFSDSQEEVPSLMKSSERGSKDYENSYRAKLNELFNLFFFYFSRNDLIKFPLKYIFYLIELLQLLSYAFSHQVF